VADAEAAAALTDRATIRDDRFHLSGVGVNFGDGATWFFVAQPSRTRSTIDADHCAAT
jgi:hypothetical protein